MKRREFLRGTVASVLIAARQAESVQRDDKKWALIPWPIPEGSEAEWSFNDQGNASVTLLCPDGSSFTSSIYEDAIAVLKWQAAQVPSLYDEVDSV